MLYFMISRSFKLTYYEYEGRYYFSSVNTIYKYKMTRIQQRILNIILKWHHVMERKMCIYWKNIIASPPLIAIWEKMKFFFASANYLLENDNRERTFICFIASGRPNERNTRGNSSQMYKRQVVWYIYQDSMQEIVKSITHLFYLKIFLWHF